MFKDVLLYQGHASGQTAFGKLGRVYATKVPQTIAFQQDILNAFWELCDQKFLDWQ